jgi:virginiamycin B lyase
MKYWWASFILAAALLWGVAPDSQSAPVPSAELVGIVKVSDGTPMEGVPVTVRGQGRTFTTSVYTNHDGQYYFPPLDAGQYKIWTQAVGFQIVRSELILASRTTLRQNFTLKPILDYQKQLSAVEWVNSLPAGTAQDRRMKLALQYNCSTCHVTGFVLSKRFDADGWSMLLDKMIETQTQPGSLVRQGIVDYKDELVAYLTRIRGPQPYPWKFKPLPRARGEANQIVVTEYDIPRGNRPEYLIEANGSDWSEGIPSRNESRVAHDAVVGKDGNIYFSDPTTPERSIGRLDPKTGHVTNFRLEDKNGSAVLTHGVAVDRKGNLWYTNGTEGTILKFDPKTEKFKRYPKPASMGNRIGGTIAIDSKGNVWATQPDGAYRLNPVTGKYTEYKSVTPEGEPYGITIDSEDNAWYAQLEADKVAWINGRTGEVGEVAVPPVSESAISPQDREIARRGATRIINTVPQIYQKGPRRIGADPEGDSVWVGEFYGGNLMKIDIHTKKVTEYRVPFPESHPYGAVIDKNHMVWVYEMNSDRVLRFNPFTEQFTEYPFPSLGTDNRFLDVDNSTDPPTLWLPYYRVNKIARMEFRTLPAKPVADAGRVLVHNTTTPVTFRVDSDRRIPYQAGAP